MNLEDGSMNPSMNLEDDPHWVLNLPVPHSGLLASGVRGVSVCCWCVPVS